MHNTIKCIIVKMCMVINHIFVYIYKLQRKEKNYVIRSSTRFRMTAQMNARVCLFPA